MHLNRRRFLGSICGPLASSTFRLPLLASPQREHINEDRLRALLLGSVIGDALAGPLEFAASEVRKGRVPGCRDWDDDRTLTKSDLNRLADTLRMEGYQSVRPGSEPYGVWIENAPPGTVTDDSRLKIILMRAIRSTGSLGKITQKEIAEAILRFTPVENATPDTKTKDLLLEGLAEYRFAANWLLGERDLEIARPIERLWSGVSNCSGQMMMLPLAGCYAGDPDATYRNVYALDFVDSPGAKDIAAALVAGLASAIANKHDSLSSQDRYQLVESTMRSIDPYQVSAVPFVGRPLTKWLKLSDSIVKRAAGSPKMAYHLLETEGKPVYFWDAHFTLLVPLVLLKLCRFNALAAMHLILDFGHDTDSYAQVLGAIAGAVEGIDLFPDSMIEKVEIHLQEYYGESIATWCQDLLSESR